MIKKNYTIVVCILFTTMILPWTHIVLAGDEDNPEIEDESGDVPFRFIDIISAWFFEDSEDPDYLYVAIKVRNLQYKQIITGYNFIWTSNGTQYSSLLITWSRGENSIYFSGVLGGALSHIAGSCDLLNDIIAMKIPKNKIGAVNAGDVLSRPFVYAIFSPFGGLLGSFPLNPLADYAPNNLQGKKYIIQY